MKKITLAEVAKSLNVSKTLVSLVLNDRGDEKGISKATQERVHKKVKELNYKANQFARGLRMGKSNTIGLIVADISNSFYAKMCRSIEDNANKHGYNVIICSSDENPEKESTLIQMLIDRQVDGLIISTTQKKNDDILNLKKNNFPFVLIDRHIPKVDTNYVIVDNKDGAKEIVNHLIQLGNKRIGHLTISPSHLSSLKDRTLGYKEALKENNIRIDNNLIKEISFENIKEDVYNQLKELLSPPQSISSLFVSNNNIAVACLECFMEMNIRVPQDVSLASFDDIDAFKLCYPPVTAISQPISKMGEAALDILIKNINCDENKFDYEHKNLKTTLQIRRSCGSFISNL
ncbi:MAG: LacI family DNA-binding transcriptional regulator [Flavobacteriales bacterium]|nr:LacI family DNA-binding transcriptional regulator [Flavobacteriales bacterium]MCB9365269.1 LacI family DNA-binding transcriptional regulator [Flavobacteriales bacterium]